MRSVWSRRYAGAVFEEDHEDGEVGGGDAGDAGGVSERDGSVKGKFLFGFVAEVWDGSEVEVAGDAAGFHFAKLGYVPVLTRDVPFVFDFDLDLLCGGGRDVEGAESVVEFEKLCEVEFGAA